MSETEYIILSVVLLFVAIFLVVGWKWIIKRKNSTNKKVTKNIDQSTDVKNVIKKYLGDNKIQNTEIVLWKIINAPIKTKIGHEIQYLYFKYKLLKTDEIKEDIIVVEFINSVYKDKLNKQKVKKFERKISNYLEDKSLLIEKIKKL